MAETKPTRKILTVGELKRIMESFPEDTPVLIGTCELCFGETLGFTEPIMCVRCNERVVVKSLVMGNS